MKPLAWLAFGASVVACNAPASNARVSPESAASTTEAPAPRPLSLIEPAGEPVAPPFSRFFVERPGPQEMAKKQWENASSHDGAECRAALAEAGVRFSSARDVPEPDKKGCGIPHGVVVTRGPTGIVYAPPLAIDCSLALHLKDIERIVQEESAAQLRTPIARIRNLGTFACRNRRGRWNDLMSEHAFGVAMDLSAFEPKKGRPVVVARDYALGKEARDPRASFLRRLYARLRAETELSFVLGPEYNAQHRDHFHLDRGYRWWL